MPKISIIVSIYNVEKYLDRCLESLVNQTYKNIEIICVDDKSTDSSAKILHRWEKKDRRILAIYLDKNKGSVNARKVAALKSTGDYMMVCDSDDAFMPTACETVALEMKRNPVDILHFCTAVEYHGRYDKQTKDDLKRILAPWKKEYSGDNLVVPCYKEKKWAFTLWNKAYDGQKARTAFRASCTAEFSMADDAYMFFLLSYYCKSYRGISDVLNIYCYGSGMSSRQMMDLARFSKNCEKLIAVDCIDAFLEAVNADDKYLECAKIIRSEMQNGIIWQWENDLIPVDKYAGYRLLLKRMGVEAISYLARDYWDKQGDIVKYLAPPKHRIEAGRTVRRIGLYYPTLRNGGAERIVTKLAYIYLELGYDVVLITEEKAQQDDYPYPSNVKRVVLPSNLKYCGDKYGVRAKAWQHIIDRENIDTVVYNMTICPSMLWDFCLLKADDINLIAFSHGIFCTALWWSVKMGSISPFVYQLADRIICLSRMDKLYWDGFGKAVFIPNPQDICPKEEMSSLDSQNVVWVGRFSEEKQPYEILHAFSFVHQKIPQATLTIVGDSSAPEWMERMKHKTRDLSLEKVVQFVGFQNPAPYYQAASVMASTSMIESWSLVISESKNYGLPMVMYDLPWLEFVRDARGISVVPQNDARKMAERIIELLRDDELRKQQGALARKSIEEMAVNVAPLWKDVLEGFSQTYEIESTEELRLMLNQMHRFMYVGIRKLEAQIANSQYAALTTGEGMAIGRVAEVVNRHEEVVNRHEEVVNRHEEVINRHEEVVNRHEEVVNRHEEVINRHEEVVNRHEEVINRHNDSINHQWEVQKLHEYRLQMLENQIPLNHSCVRSPIKRVLRKLGLGK